MSASSVRHFKVHGVYKGVLKANNGKPIVNAGLRGIGFGKSPDAGAPNTRYWAADTAGGAHGLFGAINSD